MNTLLPSQPHSPNLRRSLRSFTYFLILIGSLSAIQITRGEPDPTFQWAFRLGAGADDFGQSIATDSAGNVYVGGFFTHTVDFDPGAATNALTSGTSSAVFVAK